MTNKHARVLGKLGRARNTAAQAEASRKNGRKGGRPGKCEYLWNGHRCARRSIVRWTTCRQHRRWGHSRKKGGTR